MLPSVIALGQQLRFSTVQWAVTLRLCWSLLAVVWRCNASTNLLFKAEDPSPKMSPTMTCTNNTTTTTTIRTVEGTHYPNYTLKHTPSIVTKPTFVTATRFLPQGPSQTTPHRSGESPPTLPSRFQLVSAHSSLATCRRRWLTVRLRLDFERKTLAVVVEPKGASIIFTLKRNQKTDM